MATQVQTVPMQKYDPYPCPAADPPTATLTAKRQIPPPPLYLGRIQVTSQNPPGAATTGSVTPGSPGTAQIFLRNYHAFCDFLRTYPSQWAVAVTYDDQTNQVSDFTFYPTAPVAVVSGLEDVAELLDAGLVQLRALNANVVRVGKEIQDRLEARNGGGSGGGRRIVADASAAKQKS